MTSGPPPEISGFTFLEAIGSGGFADVFLYQQALPSRRVAVKVLRESTTEVGRAQFHAEANVMAQLSGHPSIVPIHQADVSGDGRAFLVMEYCPPPHIGQRYRKERLPVPDVLEIGVKIASALETAHRVGILHRDIKPHNILTSSYGAPLLTDFGIAAVAGGDAEANYGMSVPWSPPEAFAADAPLDVRSDVYSLGATVYSLLAGRAPSEVPGAANDDATLVHRIERQDPSRILRADVPDSLNDLLRRTLSRRIEDRPSSAMALARLFQEVQIELDLTPTRLEVIDASPPGPAPAREVSDDRTLVRPVQIIVPDQIAHQGTLLRPRLLTQADDQTLVRRRRSPAPDTVHKRPVGPVGAPPALRADLVDPPRDEAEPPARSRTRVLVGVCLGVLLVVGVGAALLFGPRPEDDDVPRAETPAPAVVVGGPATPVDLKAERRAGAVLFSWRNPAAEQGDLYHVRAGTSLGELQEIYRGERSSAEVDVAPGSQVCVSIATLRSGSISEPLTECLVVR